MKMIKAIPFEPLRRYLWNILIWATQSLNVFLWPLFNLFFWTNKFGYPDESTSSALGKLEREGSKRACYVCKVISVILRDKNHCIKSIEEDEGVGK
jgi:hypothetical protein